MSDEHITSKRSAVFIRYGQCPLPIKHLPREIQQALRIARMRPLFKECFRNCQLLILSLMGVPSNPDAARILSKLSYCEGEVCRKDGLSFDHGWFLYQTENGQVILDITLDTKYYLYSDQEPISHQIIRETFNEHRAFHCITRLRFHDAVKRFSIFDLHTKMEVASHFNFAPSAKHIDADLIIMQFATNIWHAKMANQFIALVNSREA